MAADGGPGPARLVGINHVALEVGDLDRALEFYGRLLDLRVTERHGDTMAFLDAGDQFLALSAGRRQTPDDERHFGLVVDDRERFRASLAAAGVPTIAGVGLSFCDPWGNPIQVVQYDQIRFSKVAAVLSGMGLAHLSKTPDALAELRHSGLSDQADGASSSRSAAGSRV